MLLFDTQIQKQPVHIKDEPKEGTFADVIREALERISGVGSRKENKQPESKDSYFTMASKETAPPGSSPNLERATAMLNDLRNKDGDNADRIFVDARKAAERQAGPEPKGNDVLASIKHEEKINDFMIKKLEKEIDRA